MFFSATKYIHLWNKRLQNTGEKNECCCSVLRSSSFEFCVFFFVRVFLFFEVEETQRRCGSSKQFLFKDFRHFLSYKPLGPKDNRIICTVLVQLGIYAFRFFFSFFRFDCCAIHNSQTRFMFWRIVWTHCTRILAFFLWYTYIWTNLRGGEVYWISITVFFMYRVF